MSDEQQIDPAVLDPPDDVTERPPDADDPDTADEPDIAFDETDDEAGEAPEPDEPPED